jgi:hypothetical protein
VRTPRYVLVAALLLPLATLAPYLYGLRVAAQRDLWFTWIHSLNPWDPYTYLAWIEQARQGRLLFRQLFTPEPSGAVLFHPLFLAIGWAARASGVSSLAAFQAARLALGALLVVLVHSAVRRFVAEGPAARATFLFACVSGGVGWVFREAGAPLTSGPIDLWMPEASLFLSMLESPLFIAAWCLVIGILLAAVPEAEAARPRPWLAATFASALGFIHPYDLVTVIAAFAIALAGGALLRWPRPRGLALTLGALVAGAAPPAAYHALVLGRDEVFATYARSVNTPSPSPERYALAFLPSLALGAFGLARVRATRRPRDLLLVAWPVATALLVYAPVAFQRRFILGAQLPLAILAGIGAFDAIGRRLAPRGARAGRRALGAALVAAALAASSLSNVAVVREDLAAYTKHTFPQFLPKDLVRVIEIFAETAPPDAVIFGHRHPAGYVVPGMTGRRTYVGHYDQTIDLSGKMETVKAFYDAGTSDEARRKFLRGAGITHVLHSPAEYAVLGKADLAAMPYLEEVAHEGMVRLYRVRREMLGE